MVRGSWVVLGGLVLVASGCTTRAGGFLVSPIADVVGCYALQPGEWPADMVQNGFPDPMALPQVIELHETPVGPSDEPSVDGRWYEVRSHTRRRRGILHRWRLVEGNRVVVETAGPSGFTLDFDVGRSEALGTVAARAEGSDPVVVPLRGILSPCPRPLPSIGGR